MCLSWMLDKKYVVLADWFVAFGTLGAAGTALWVSTIGAKRAERKQWRNDSRLGAIIINSLLEEINTGLNIMKAAQDAQNPSTRAAPVHMVRQQMPSASWEKSSTIPDNVLLRIAAILESRERQSCVSHCMRFLLGEEHREGADREGLCLTDIRIHCKNYFVNIVASINGGNQNYGYYIDATKNVMAMLNKTKAILEKNARRRRPM